MPMLSVGVRGYDRGKSPVADILSHQATENMPPVEIQAAVVTSVNSACVSCHVLEALSVCLLACLPLIVCVTSIGTVFMYRGPDMIIEDTSQFPPCSFVSRSIDRL